MSSSIFVVHFAISACVHGSTNGTNGIPISFKVLPRVQLVIPLVPMVPLVKTVGSQYCRQLYSVGKITNALKSHDPIWRPKSNRKAMNRNWSNQKANPALKPKTGNK